jgi:uncharacterized protein (DUF1697 family)
MSDHETNGQNATKRRRTASSSASSSSTTTTTTGSASTQASSLAVDSLTAARADLLSQQVALFRAINVGGSKPLSMQSLTEWATISLKLNDVKTVSQTGNLIFARPDPDSALCISTLKSELGRASADQTCEPLLDDDRERQYLLEPYLEQKLADDLHVQTTIMLRNTSEWEHVIAENPFSVEAERDPSHLVVVFLKTAPPEAEIAAAKLKAAIVGNERISLIGKHLYVYYPDGIGKSKLTSKVIEKALAVPGTARNWNTVLKVRQVLQLPRVS